MTRPRLAWRVREWSRGSFVEELPDFRARFGEPFASIVELARSVAQDDAGDATPQDIKHTLDAIAAGAAGVDLARLDSMTEALMLHQAWRLFRVARVARLSELQATVCAAAARAEFNGRNGRPSSARAVHLVRELLAAGAESLPRRHRDELLKAALRACYDATPLGSRFQAAYQAAYSDGRMKRLLRLARAQR